MKKLIIKKLSDNSIIEETMVADHDEFQWVKENKHRFGQDDVYEEKQVLVKEAWSEVIPADHINGTLGRIIEHEAIYETVKELITPKDWYVETVDMTEEIKGKEKKKKEVKERLKEFKNNKPKSIAQLNAIIEDILEVVGEL